MLALLVISAVSVLGVFGCMDSGHTGREQGAQPLKPSESPTAHPFERRLVDLNGKHLSIVEAGIGYPIIFVHDFQLLKLSEGLPSGFAGIGVDFR